MFAETSCPAVTHDSADLIFSLFQLRRRTSFDKNHQRAAPTKNLLVSGVGNIDQIVTRKTEDFSERLQHADNQKRTAGNVHLLADNPVRGRSLEKILRNISADNANLARTLPLIFIPGSTCIDGYGIDVEHSSGSDTTNKYVVRLLVQVFDNFRSTGGDARLVARSAHAEDDFGIIPRYILSLAELDEVFARGNHPGLLGDGEYCGSLRREGLGNGLVQSLDNRDHGDYRRNADDYSHQRQGGAQLVCAQTANSYEKRLPERSQTKQRKSSFYGRESSPGESIAAGHCFT